MSDITDLDQHRTKRDGAEVPWERLKEIRKAVSVLDRCRQSEDPKTQRVAQTLQFDSNQSLTLNVTVTDPRLTQAVLMAMGQGQPSLIPGMRLDGVHIGCLKRRSEIITQLRQYLDELEDQEADESDS